MLLIVLSYTKAQVRSFGNDKVNNVAVGFLTLQLAVDNAILGAIGGSKAPYVNVTTDAYPSPNIPQWKRYSMTLPLSYTKAYSRFEAVRGVGLETAGSLLAIIALFISCFRMITDIVREKEVRIRENMDMMGLHEGIALIATAAQLTLGRH